MKRRRLLRVGAMAALLAGAGIVVSAQTRREPAGRPRGFDDYAIVMQRNIFDPRRRPVRPAGDSAPAPVPVETVSLLGTWLSASGTVALMESNVPDYGGSREVGDMIGGWRIDSIGLEAVVLVRGEDRTRLPVGQRIERVSGGDWTLAGTTAPGSGGSFSNGRASQGPSSNSSTASSAGGSAEEILERMRQRRQQETRQ